MAEPKKIVPGSLEYFGLCAVGGMLSCGLTHTAVTPLDLVKCNAQANPQLFKNTMVGFSKIYSGSLVSEGFKGGLAGLVRGWAPTLWGYSVQGIGKFGFYEIFEHIINTRLGKEKAHEHRITVHIISSASAEFFADLGLCPFEAVKVRVQTNPKFANGLFDGLPKFISQEGFGNLYAGIAPLWARQIPYTVIKFVAFEQIAEVVYGMCPKPKSQMNTLEQMGVVFASGYLAGVICGAVSHPADTTVSKINKLQSAGGVMEKMRIIYSGDGKGAPGIGFKGLWNGFVPRVIMIGTLTGLQWFIYGAFKAAVGLPTPGKDVRKAPETTKEEKH